MKKMKKIFAVLILLVTLAGMSCFASAAGFQSMATPIDLPVFEKPRLFDEYDGDFTYIGPKVAASYSDTTWIDDFTGDGKKDVLYYLGAKDGQCVGDFKLGRYVNGSMVWNPANNCAGFGNLLRSDVKIFTGKFTGSSNAEVLFYASNGDWWLGTFSDCHINWNRATNCAGFGNLLRSDVKIWTGNFTGSVKTEVLFYTSSGEWWLGTFSGTAMTWNRVYNNAGFGNLLRSDVKIWTGNFTGKRQNGSALLHQRR